MNYEVTIGIPVYNAEKHLRLALDSALAQTFESIEYLVLDDCGTDGSVDIVREYQQSHTRGKDIHIVRQPQNMGIGHGRNRIIDEAQGRYLFFLDADDELPPRAIEVLYNAAQKYSVQLVYGSNERIIDMGGKQRVESYNYEFAYFASNDALCNYAYDEYDRIAACVWKFLIDISVYRDNHLRFPDVNYWEDFTMTIDLPTYVDGAVFLPDIIYRYYSRLGTLSNNQERKSIKKQEIEGIAEAIGLLKARGERIRQKPYYLKRCLKLMKTEFFMVCYVLKNKPIVSPSFSNRELRDMMRSPLAWSDVLGFSRWQTANLFFKLLGVLPSVLSVELIRMVGKVKKLV